MQAFANLFAQNRNKLILTTGVPVPYQFSNPAQIRWSERYKKILLANGGNTVNFCVQNADLSSFSQAWLASASMRGISSDSNNIYSIAGSTIRKWSGFFESSTPSAPISNPRMIDAAGDPSYLYMTSNNATDHHGFRQIKKSNLEVTASALADGSGDGQFNNPLGIFYYSSEIFVADYDNSRISVWTKSGETLTYARKYDLGFKPMDLAFDGTNWYVQSVTNTYKYDNVFTDATKTSTACGGYSLTIIPDQGDGYGATLAIVDSTNSHLERRKCSDLSAINSVGSSGDGSSSLCDPQITSQAGTWIDSECGRYSVASGANISKNGFSGDFFRQTPNRMTYQPTGRLSDITAIDFNADAIVGEIKNLHKCINLTSLKLQTNPALVLNLSRLSAKLTTLRAYACGAGVSGSIRHMTALTSVNLRENGASQAQVDAWIDDLWQNRDVMAICAVNLNGNNAAPSGVYQDASPPTTGNEKVFDLVENYGWTVANS